MRWPHATLLVALVSGSIVSADEAKDQKPKPVDAKAADTKPAPKPPDAKAPTPFEGKAELGTTIAAPATELYQTVQTKKSRAELSKFLIKPAQVAMKKRNWAQAVPLYQALVVARGAGSPEAKQLATLWTLAGQNEDAAEAWNAYAIAVKDEKGRAAAQAEAARLASAPDPFAGKLTTTEMGKEAKQAFSLGRAAFKANNYADALVYFHMGYVLAPDLPGFLRELGSTYDKLGASDRKKEFYRRYLVSRPFGPNADVVRGELAREKDALGTLLVSSHGPVPCAELWVNRQRINGKLPDKGLLVAPGTYKGLCFHPKYEMAMFEYATVEAGKPAAMNFRWAIVVNKLEKPYGRITLESPTGAMNDLGITSQEVGVPVPADGHKLKMVLKDDSGVRVEKRDVQIDAGQKLVVQW